MRKEKKIRGENLIIEIKQILHQFRYSNELMFIFFYHSPITIRRFVILKSVSQCGIL